MRCTSWADKHTDLDLGRVVIAVGRAGGWLSALAALNGRISTAPAVVGARSRTGELMTRRTRAYLGLPGDGSEVYAITAWGLARTGPTGETISPMLS